MTSKKELQIAVGLAIIMLIVGISSYAAFPARIPDPPGRIMFKVVAGKVLFDHKFHSSPGGYGLSCFDCHHHFLEEETELLVCRDCHNLPAEEETFPAACADCHEPDEIEDTEMLKMSDAFHGRCAVCHKEFESGPCSEACASCHVM